MLGSGAKVLRYVLQSAMLGIGAYLVVIEQASGGIMIASSILMGRALAPIEVALTNWKQLVAAREGIVRLREIIKATAAPLRPRSRCRGRTGPDGPRSQCSSPGTESPLFPVFLSAQSGDGHGAARPERGGQIVARAAPVGSGRPRTGRCVSTAPRSTNGILTILAVPRLSAAGCRAVRRHRRDNIARFDDSASSEAILEAARIAGAHEMILRLPTAMTRQIGEGGSALSSGSGNASAWRGRVWRSFLVVLDEPDANLDVEGEKALADDRNIAQRSSIVIVISHSPALWRR